MYEEVDEALGLSARVEAMEVTAVLLQPPP